MPLTIEYYIPGHLDRAYYPALIALAMRHPRCIRVDLSLFPGADKLTLGYRGDSTDDGAIRAELDATSYLGSPFCPCGCNAVILFNNCFKVDPILYDLDDDEKYMVRRGEWIEAIRSIRSRTGIGLKAAKEALDRFRDSERK